MLIDVTLRMLRGNLEPHLDGEAERMRRRIRSAAAEELSLTEGAVLVQLDKNGPATTADLARAESVKPQSMGATIASLEERGLVERKPRRTDGRQMNIVVTAKGA